MGFVVRRVHDRCAVDVEPVAERDSRVVEVAGGDHRPAEVEASLDEILVVDLGLQLFEGDGEVAVLHLPRQDLAQRCAEAARTVDAPPVVGLEQRREERQTLDVIPVGVTDEDVPVDGIAGRPVEQVEAQGMATGAAVDHDHGPVVRLDLDTRGVAPVEDRGRARLGDRPPGPPERDVHRLSPSRGTSACRGRGAPWAGTPRRRTARRRRPASRPHR